MADELAVVQTWLAISPSGPVAYTARSFPWPTPLHMDLGMPFLLKSLEAFVLPSGAIR